MAFPGFTASKSVYLGRHQYRSQLRVSISNSSVMPQQDNGKEAPGTCCGTHCSGLCLCSHGHGACASVTEGESAHNVILRATDSVSMAIDSCHADQPVDGGYAFVTCECGCWASTHDAGCFACS